MPIKKLPLSQIAVTGGAFLKRGMYHSFLSSFRFRLKRIAGMNFIENAEQFLLRFCT